MKYYELDKEEEEILKAYEAGKLKTIKNFGQEKEKYMAAARTTLNKTRNINIRLYDIQEFDQKI